MGNEVDHYRVLGLLSGEEGSKLSQKEISKGYRLKARELHPDKRPNDSNAHSNFQKLQISYGILSDEKARRLFDDLLRVKRQQHYHKEQLNSKRQKMVSDLEMRERAAAFAADAAKEKEEEMIDRKLKEEIARIRAMQTSKVSSSRSWSKGDGSGGAGDLCDLDRTKVLKVSWDRGVADCYNSKRIREIFERFGRVEDVVIRSSKLKGSAIVVLDSVDAVVAASASVCGDHSNPLLVLPLQPVAAVKSDFSNASGVAVPGQLDKLVGSGYQEFEDSVLKKLQKASEKQK